MYIVDVDLWMCHVHPSDRLLSIFELTSPQVGDATVVCVCILATLLYIRCVDRWDGDDSTRFHNGTSEQMDFAFSFWNTKLAILFPIREHKIWMEDGIIFPSSASHIYAPHNRPHWCFTIKWVKRMVTREAYWMEYICTRNWYGKMLYIADAANRRLDVNQPRQMKKKKNKTRESALKYHVKQAERLLFSSQTLKSNRI